MEKAFGRSSKIYTPDDKRQIHTWGEKWKVSEEEIAKLAKNVRIQRSVL